jgi:hypothetical protein
MNNRDNRIGQHVQCTAKHLSGKTGKVDRMDRGNVWVKLDGTGELVCTRWAKLEPIIEAPFYE